MKERDRVRVLRGDHEGRTGTVGALPTSPYAKYLAISPFNGVKVFCATMIQQRQALGEQITAWITAERRQHPGFEIVDIVMRQSSDKAFHCVSAVLFFKYDGAAKEKHRG